MGRQHVFVTGIPRSGTTLLANLLNAQPGVTLWSNALGGLLAVAQRFGGFRQTLDSRQRNVVLSWLDYELQHRPLTIRIGPNDFQDIGQLYARVLDGIAGPTDRVVGHKVNAYGPHSDVFSRLLNETSVHVICVVRDIRDVMLSQSNHLHRQLTSFRNWRVIARSAHQWRDHPRFLRVRFEDLLRNTREAVAPLEVRLGCAVHTDLEHLVHIDQPWTENSAFHDIERLFDPRALERWRRHTDNPLVREAAWACQAELEYLGYPSLEEPFGIREQLRFARHRITTTGAEGFGHLKRRLAEISLPRVP